MSKCLNELTFDEIVEKQLSDDFDNFFSDYMCYEAEERFGTSDADELKNYEEEAIENEWKERFNIEDFIENLSENQNFKDKIKEAIIKFLGR